MTDISELGVILENPIGEGLDGFRRRFESTCADLGIAGSQNVVEQVVLLAASGGSRSALLVVKFLADVYRCQKPHP
jgi:hypothetical protein